MQLLDYQGEFNGFPAPPSERRHSVELPSVPDQDIAEILPDKLDPAPWISTDVLSTGLSEENKHQGFEQPAVNETVEEEEGVMDINADGRPRDLAEEAPLLDNVETHIQSVSDRHLEVNLTMHFCNLADIFKGAERLCNIPHYPIFTGNRFHRVKCYPFG